MHHQRHLVRGASNCQHKYIVRACSSNVRTHLRNVEPSRSDVCGNKNLDAAFAEILKRLFASRLSNVAMQSLGKRKTGVMHRWTQHLSHVAHTIALGSALATSLAATA